jgi:hypothetical protein
MVLVHFPSGLRIAREEMLDSTRVAPDGASEEVAPPADWPKLAEGELALLRVLFPRFDPRTRRVAPDGALVRTLLVPAHSGPADGVAVELVESAQSDDLEVEAALVSRAGPAPEVLARGRFSEGAESGLLGDGRFVPSIRLAEAPVHAPPAAFALTVDFTFHGNAPTDGFMTRERLVFFGRRGARLEKLLDLETLDDKSDAECPSSVSSALAAGPGSSHGLPDLVETVRRETSHFDGHDCHLKESKRSRTWRFDGRAYRR